MCVYAITYVVPFLVSFLLVFSFLYSVCDSKPTERNINHWNWCTWTMTLLDSSTEDGVVGQEGNGEGPFEVTSGASLMTASWLPYVTATSKLPPDMRDGDRRLAREVEVPPPPLFWPPELKAGCTRVVAAVSAIGVTMVKGSGLASIRWVKVGLDGTLLSLIGSWLSLLFRFCCCLFRRGSMEKIKIVKRLVWFQFRGVHISELLCEFT